VDSERLLTVVADLFLRTHPGTPAIAVPVTSSGEIDIIASRYGTRVMKTRNSHLAMMEATPTRTSSSWRHQGRVHFHGIFLRHGRDVLRGQDPRDDGANRQAAR